MVRDGKRSDNSGVSRPWLVRNRQGSETGGRKADSQSQGQKAGRFTEGETANAGQEQYGSALAGQAVRKC